MVIYGYDPTFGISRITVKRTRGSGGGASGRTIAFCLSKPGSNPGTDLAFFRNAINLFSLGVGLYLKKTGHRKCYILFLLLSCFLSYKRVYINCIVPMNQRKENKNIPKRGRERPILKKPVKRTNDKNEYKATTSLDVPFEK